MKKKQEVMMYVFYGDEITPIIYARTDEEAKEQFLERCPNANLEKIRWEKDRIVDNDPPHIFVTPW